MPRPNRQSPQRRKLLPASLAAIAVLAVTAAVLWVKERRPAQDLRVSFHIPIAAPDNPTITYTLQNLGRQPVALRGAALLAIADNPPMIDPSDNVELCDKIDPAALKPPEQASAQGSQIAGDAGQQQEEYAPVSLSAGGKPYAPHAVFEIADGQSLTITATFKTDNKQMKDKSNQVFCPIVWLAHAGLETAAICQGFATATNRGGVSNTIVARQFRLLPPRAGISCPAIGR